MSSRTSHLYQVARNKFICFRVVCLALTGCLMMIAIIGCSSASKENMQDTTSSPHATDTANKPSIESKTSLIDLKDSIANIGIDFKNVVDLQKKMAIPIIVPSQIPEGYQNTIIKKLQDPPNEAAVLFYEKGEKSILYLVQREGEYDFTNPTLEFDSSEKKINGYDISIGSIGEQVVKAFWQTDGLTYSIDCTGISKIEMETILNNLKVLK